MNNSEKRLRDFAQISYIL